MTLDVVLRYNDIIKSIIDNGTEISPVVKFKLLGMIVQFKPIVDNFIQIRDELLKKYGKESAEGGIGIFKPIEDNFKDDKAGFEQATKEYEEAIQKYTADIEALAKTEATIEIQKFKAADIMTAGIPADALVILYDLIEE